MVGAIAVNYHNHQQRRHPPMGSFSDAIGVRSDGETVPLAEPSFREPLSSSLSTVPLRVVTFDLDNTLWCTASTIGTAIAAVNDFWENQSIQPAVCTEIIMKELFAANKAKYAPLQAEKATSPCQLTQLRIDAMQHLLTTHHDMSREQAAELAKRSFQVMAQARHDAIPHHMASKVVETLQTLRCNNRHVLIGAITDGNANPGCVEALAPFFDFCVQAENVGVCKPDSRIFEHAIQHVQQLQSTSSSCIEHGHPISSRENLLAGWVHIGDDWAKDIVGAKEMGMRTIWCRELILSSSSPGSLSASHTKDFSCWETKKNKTKGSSQSSNMTHPRGVEDTSCADAIVDRFADIATVLHAWQQEKPENSQQ